MGSNNLAFPHQHQGLENADSTDDYESVEALLSAKERLSEMQNDDDMIAETAKRLHLDENAVIIAVMGITGVGKSTFIEHLTKSGAKIGKSLHSCTTSIGVHPFRHLGQTIWLVDTPGFDDTHRTNTQVLEDIAHFLGAAYSKKIALAGIVYLHPITNNRIKGSDLKNLVLFQELCGKSSLSSVVLATTMWDRIPNANGGSQMAEAFKWEKELIETPDFWGDMIEEGAKVFRQDAGYSSAFEIIQYILGLKNESVLDIQRELILEHLPLNQTNAGKEVQKEVYLMKKEYQNDLERIRNGVDRAKEAGKERLAKKLLEIESQTKEKDAQTERDLQALQQSFDKLQKDKDEQHRKEMDEVRLERKQIEEDMKKELARIETIEMRQRQSEQEFQELSRKRSSDDAHFQEKLQRMREAHEKELERLGAERARKEKKEHSVAGLISVFGGAAAVGFGLATMNPAMVSVGGTMIAGGAAAESSSE